MADLRTRLFANNPYDIKSGRGIVQLMTGQVDQGRPTYLHLLSTGYRLCRKAEPTMLSGFYLDENTGVSISADNINFAGFLSIVSGLDPISFGQEIGNSDFFPPFTEAYPFAGQTL